MHVSAKFQSQLPEGSELSIANIDSVYLLRSIFTRYKKEPIFAIDVEFQAQVRLCPA
jgi:hypothetical protein